MDLICNLAGCNKPKAASLGRDAFCMEHFISACYRQIEKCAEQFPQAERSGDTDSIAHDLTELVSTAAGLGVSAGNLSNLERAQLLDIILWASDLNRHLRRSPRKRASIPVRLSYQGPGIAWQQETETRMVSRLGALVECRNPLEPGEKLLLQRMDTGQQAQARVAWRGPRRGGHQEIGLEILDFDNFWGMEW